MENSLFAYIERLELIAFFAGYSLIYTIVQVIASRQNKKPTSFINRLVFLLPLGYALIATLFLGLILKNLYPDYSFKNITHQFQYPYLILWGLLAMLFWLPFFNKKPLYSLLHSLVFFFLLLQDMYAQLTSAGGGKEILRNDMKIYSDSLLLNIASLLFILIIHSFFIRISNNKKASAQS